MKSRISLLLLAVALAASSTLLAHASACSNMTLKGTWANSIHGQIFLPDGSTLLIDGIVKTTYDGEGNFTQVDAVADNGNIAPGWRPGWGHLHGEPRVHRNLDPGDPGHAPTCTYSSSNPSLETRRSSW